MCESSACFDAYELWGGVVIHTSNREDNDITEISDTIEAWIQFRDDIKAGKYDHIGKDL